mgnify:CR=1 FL=1
MLYSLIKTSFERILIDVCSFSFVTCACPHPFLHFLQIVPNLLSVFTHDQVSAIPLAPEDILPIEQVHQIVKTHNENSARLLQNYKEITTITTAPTSSSNRRAKRDKPKTSLIAIKSRDMLPKEMKAQDQLRLQQQDPAKYQAFTDSAAKNNHLLAGLMFGKNVKVDKPKKLPSKNQQSSNADANAPEEDKTSRANHCNFYELNFSIVQTHKKDLQFDNK